MVQPFARCLHYLSLVTAMSAFGGSSLPAAADESQGSQLATPTPEQVAWHDLDVGMFIHFGMETYQDTETDDFSTPLSQFNPEQLDTDQWVRVAESMHAKYIILVAKHVGGFCLWQTDSSDYSVGHTPWRGGKGDVLADLTESCRKRGMLWGVYVYPGDLYHGSPVSSGGKTDDPEKQAQYNKIYLQQLTEVLSRYGTPMEIWFDGSVRKDLIDLTGILQRYAPQAIIFNSPWATIRWVGNEEGITPYPAWSSVSREAALSGVSETQDSDPDGDAWLPIEADARLRAGWFWSSTSEDTIKSVAHLMKMYYQSVGHGAVLLLNVTPDTTGRIPEADARRAAEFGAEITRRFGVWVARTSGRGPVIELNLDGPTVIDHVITMEDIRHGERVREYVVEGLVKDQWQPLASGTMIGHKKIDRFEPLEVSKVRLRATESAATPIIRELAVYNTQTSVQIASASRPAPAESDSAWATVATWNVGQFQGDSATITADLTGFVDEARQYELLVRPSAGDANLTVSAVHLLLQSSRLPAAFVKRLENPHAFNLNVTATPVARAEWCTVEITVTSESLPGSAGEILVRKRPLH